MVTNLDSGYVEVTPGMGCGLKGRLITAGWFTGAAIVPVFFFFVLTEAMTSNAGSGARSGIAVRGVWLFAVLPISTAALMGFIFGWQIVDPNQRTTPTYAALQGMLVALFSYVLFTIVFGAWLTWADASSGAVSVSTVVPMLITIFLVGFVFVGWLVLIAGAIAGWLLFRSFSKKPRPLLKRIGRESRERQPLDRCSGRSVPVDLRWGRASR
jgi:hypothetical protein